ESHNPLRDPRDRRLPRMAGPCSLVIFGVTGDLARKKLLPSVYDLAAAGLLPPGFGLVGFGRREWTDEQFREFVLESIEGRTRSRFSQAVWERLAEGTRFVGGAFDEDAAYGRLADTLGLLDAERGTAGNYAFYLAIPPGSFPAVCTHLDAHGLAQGRRAGAADRRGAAGPAGGMLSGGSPDHGPRGGEDDRDQWRRVVIEKPFGHDLESARALNAAITEVFDERNV